MNILADLFDTQADDVLEEWAESDHTPLFKSIDNTLLIRAGVEELDFRIIEVADLTKAECAVYSMYSQEIDVNDRPTEREAIDNVTEWLYSSHYMPDLSKKTGKQLLREANDYEQRKARSAFVKSLDIQHKAWLGQIKHDLMCIHTMTELYALTSTCISHDEHLANLAGRSFCDSFAALSFDFMQAEVRIRRGIMPISKTVTVHTQPMPVVASKTAVVAKFPVVMVNKGGKALAFSQREVERYANEGWTCVTRS